MVFQVKPLITVIAFLPLNLVASFLFPTKKGTKLKGFLFLSLISLLGVFSLDTPTPAQNSN